MSTSAHFQMFARYNSLANDLVYECAAALSDEARKQDRLGFFGSIHNTLNHLMVGDRLWMARFEGKPVPPNKLSDVLFDDFDELRAGRALEDERISDFMASLTQDYLDQTMSFASVMGGTFSLPMTLALSQLFNHQTHHRGQVHHMLGMAGAQTPVLDMPFVMQTRID